MHALKDLLIIIKFCLARIIEVACWIAIRPSSEYKKLLVAFSEIKVWGKIIEIGAKKNLFGHRAENIGKETEQFFNFVKGPYDLWVDLPAWKLTCEALVKGQVSALLALTSHNLHRLRTLCMFFTWKFSTCEGWLANGRFFHSQIHVKVGRCAVVFQVTTLQTAPSFLSRRACRWRSQTTSWRTPTSLRRSRRPPTRAKRRTTILLKTKVSKRVLISHRRGFCVFLKRNQKELPYLTVRNHNNETQQILNVQSQGCTDPEIRRNYLHIVSLSQSLLKSGGTVACLGIREVCAL